MSISPIHDHQIIHNIAQRIKNQLGLTHFFASINDIIEYSLQNAFEKPIHMFDPSLFDLIKCRLELLVESNTREKFLVSIEPVNKENSSTLRISLLKSHSTYDSDIFDFCKNTLFTPLQEDISLDISSYRFPLDCLPPIYDFKRRDGCIITVESKIKPLFTSDGMAVFIGRRVGEILSALTQISREITVLTYTASNEGLEVLIGSRIKRITNGIPKITVYFCKWVSGSPENIQGVSLVKIIEGILHAKLYYFETVNGPVVCISSANLTREGLINNFEFLVLITNPSVIREINDIVSAIRDGKPLPKTARILHTSSLSEMIKNLFMSAKEIVIVTAFLGNELVETIQDFIISDASCKIVIPERLDKGSYSAIKRLFDDHLKARIYAIPDLHAKMIICEKGILLTTANFTVSGFEREFNIGLFINLESEQCPSDLRRKIVQFLIENGRKADSYDELMLVETGDDERGEQETRNLPSIRISYEKAQAPFLRKIDKKSRESVRKKPKEEKGPPREILPLYVSSANREYIVLRIITVDKSNKVREVEHKIRVRENNFEKTIRAFCRILKFLNLSAHELEILRRGIIAQIKSCHADPKIAGVLIHQINDAVEKMKKGSTRELSPELTVSSKDSVIKCKLNAMERLNMLGRVEIIGYGHNISKAVDVAQACIKLFNCTCEVEIGSIERSEKPPISYIRIKLLR